jgi:hypothetical protein
MKNKVTSSTLLILALSIQSTAQSMSDTYQNYIEKRNEILQSYNIKPLDTLKENNESGKLIEWTFLKKPTATQYNIKSNLFAPKGYTNFKTKLHKDFSLNDNKHSAYLILYKQKSWFKTRNIFLQVMLKNDMQEIEKDLCGIVEERTEIRTKRVVGAFSLAALTGLGLYWFAKK